MDDRRLIRDLRLLDAPAKPRPAFVEDLHATLASELGQAPVMGDRSVRPRVRARRGRVAFTLNANVKLAATIAAVMIVGVIGFNLLPTAPTGIGGPRPTASSAPTPTPTPIPSPTPTPSPSPSFDPLSACAGVCRGELPVTVTYESRAFEPALTYAIPSGWVNNIDLPRAYGLAADGGYIGLTTGPFVDFADPDCEGRGQAPAGVGTTVAEVVAALSGDPRLLAAPAQAVTIGDRTGQILDMQIAPSWTGTCAWSDGMPGVHITGITDDLSGPGFRLAGTERARFIFLDVGESVVSINIGVTNGTDFEAFAAEVMPIIESMRFTP